MAILINITIITSGCWNYREIEKLDVVSACAIDKNGDEFILTVETVNFSSDQKESISKPFVVTARGKSIFDAIRNTISKSGRKLYWSHTKVIIISKDIAEEGVLPVLDWIFRGAEMRGDARILVSKEDTASQIIFGGNDKESTVGMHLDKILKSQRFVTTFPSNDLWEFTDSIVSEGISSIAPYVVTSVDNGINIPAVEGTALFKGDKMVGWISGKESKLVIWLKDKIIGGTIMIQDIIENKENISLEMFENQTQLDPILNDGSVLMNIMIKCNMEISELGKSQVEIDSMSIEKLEKDTEKYIKEKMENIIKKIQKEYKTDIFGFGKEIMQKYPNYWNKIKSQKEELFKELDVVVKVDAQIKGSALLSKPLEMGD